eukprot:Colp12_sorted_trinity150504_noHs@34772
MGSRKVLNCLVLASAVLLVSSLPSEHRSARAITPLPAKQIGLYVLLADDTVAGYTQNDDWTPALFDYQKKGANVLYFSFVHPGTMKIPSAFPKLAAEAHSLGKTVIFAIGGYTYSLDPNPWTWLTSQAAAEKMAETVATWTQFGADGIDLDLETGAGDAADAGKNLI